MQLSDIDLTDMDRFQDAFPHEWFTYLRQEAPVWFHPPTDTEGNERGFWVVDQVRRRRRRVPRLADASRRRSRRRPRRAGS